MKEKIIGILIDHQPKNIMNDGSIAGFVQHTEYSLIAYEIEQLVNQEVEKRIAERMPSEEEVLQYFNNHFDCYADAEHVEIAMTNTAVLKLIWWFRNRMEGKA